MQLKDISIKTILEQQQQWQDNNDLSFTYEILSKKYNCSEKLIYKKMEKLVDKDYLEYGVSLRTAWLTEKGLKFLKENK